MDGWVDGWPAAACDSDNDSEKQIIGITIFPEKDTETRRPGCDFPHHDIGFTIDFLQVTMLSKQNLHHVPYLPR